MWLKLSTRLKICEVGGLIGRTVGSSCLPRKPAGKKDILSGSWALGAVGRFMMRENGTPVIYAKIQFSTM